MLYRIKAIKKIKVNMINKQLFQSRIKEIFNRIKLSKKLFQKVNQNQLNQMKKLMIKVKKINLQI